MTLEVVTVTTGPLRQNGYILLDGAGAGVIIDPGGEAERFQAVLTGAGARPLAILATHGHFDHIGAVQDLVEVYGSPFLIHVADHALVRRANLFGTAFGGGVRVRTPTSAAPLDADDAQIRFGDLQITVRHTPGHTGGGVCFEVAGNLFTGDTLLAPDHPANKFPGADPALLQASLMRIRTWDQTLRVYPGHGPSALLGDVLEKIEGSGRHGRD